MYFYFSPHRGATERGGWPTLVHSSISHSIASYSSAFTGSISFLFLLLFFFYVICIAFTLLPDIAKVKSHGNEDHAPPQKTILNLVNDTMKYLITSCSQSCGKIICSHRLWPCVTHASYDSLLSPAGWLAVPAGTPSLPRTRLFEPTGLPYPLHASTPIRSHKVLGDYTLHS